MKRKERAEQALAVLTSAGRLDVPEPALEGFPWRDAAMTRIRALGGPGGMSPAWSRLGRMLPVACMTGLAAAAFGIFVLFCLRDVNAALAEGAVQSALYSLGGLLPY